MRRPAPLLMLCVLGTLALACLGPRGSAAAGLPQLQTASTADSSWSEAFNQTGTDDHVMCALVRQDTLIIGGLFTHVGKQELHGVAATDGTRWWGYGAGLADSVLCLVEWNGQLVAGGSFTTAEGAPANYLAVWNGSTWEPFPTPVNHRVDALTVYHGKLIAGGFFTAAGSTSLNRIGAWDGVSWAPLGTGVAQDTPEVFALHVWRDSLVVGGRFLEAGGLPTSNLAFWDGMLWKQFPAGPDGTVWNLTDWQSLLVISGPYAYAGGAIASGISAYDGSKFSSFAWGMDNAQVDGIAAYHGDVYAIGGFDKAGMKQGGGLAATSIARWDGTAWSTVGTGIIRNGSRTGRRYQVAVVYHDLLICGGWFFGGGGLTSPTLVAWNDTTWLSITRGQGVNVDPYAACTYHGKLIVGGSFGTAGETIQPSIAAWTGSEWQSLAGGIYSTPVRALATFGDSLIAGGTFIAAGSVPVLNVAAWDGTAWHALGAGLNGQVNALTVWNGKLIAGGAFTKSGTRTTNHVAVWTGTGWFPLTTGVDGTVWSLGVYNGALVVGGQFHTAGGVPAECIALFTGTAWQALGSGLTLSSGSTALAQVLQPWNGELIVGGTFTSAGGVPANYLAAWNGSTWREVGGGIQGPNLQVASLLVDSTGALVVGGTFATAGGVTCNNLGRWDGAQWSAYGSGFTLDYSTGGVWDLEAFQGSLFAVGSMNTAGGKKSNNIARWDPPRLTAVQPETPPSEPVRVGLSRVRVLRSGGATVSCEVVASSAGILSVEVMDVRGRLVRRLRERVQSPGAVRFAWDGAAQSGGRAARGVYVLRLRAGAATAVTKAVLGE